MEKVPTINQEGEQEAIQSTLAEEAKVVPMQPENVSSKRDRIRALKKEIAETIETKERAKRLQESYPDVPDSALTEEYKIAKEKDLKSLQTELDKLKQEKKNAHLSFKQKLRKVAAFFSF